MKVSIIIPVFQVSAYIERCICSVIAQSYTNIECIVVDDATKDDSIEKCEKLISAHQGSVQFSIIHHKQNRGLSASRNTGTETASGEYIYYLDGDDEISPDCIEKLVAPTLKDGSIEMVMGGVARYDTRNPVPKKIQDKYYSSNTAVRDFFFSKKGFYVGAWNKLIKKDFLIKNQLFFTEGLLCEDQLWSFWVVKYLNHLYQISDITYFYYVRPNSITTGTDKEKMALHWARVYEEIASNFTSEESRREAKHYAKGLCVRYVEYHWCRENQKFTDHYINALSDGKYILEKYLIKATVSLSKSTTGWAFLNFLISITKNFLNKQQS